jgi:hypothetical protein
MPAPDFSNHEQNTAICAHVCTFKILHDLAHPVNCELASFQWKTETMQIPHSSAFIGAFRLQQNRPYPGPPRPRLQPAGRALYFIPERTLDRQLSPMLPFPCTRLHFSEDAAIPPLL